MEEEFSSSQIDDHFYEDGQETHAGKLEVLQLKDNSIRRGILPLEEIFYHDGVSQKPTMMPTEVGREDLNMGTPEKLRMVKISKYLSPEMKGK